jgi:hypothetical protein
MYKNYADCAIRKSHLAVLVAICQLQLNVGKKASKKPRIKMLMKLTPGCHWEELGSIICYRQH